MPGLLARLLPSRLLREGSVVALGIGVSSLAALLGMRLLTELIAPALFGGLALANGLVTLLLGVLVTPISQAGFRFWPEYAARGATGQLVGLLSAAIGQRMLGAVALVGLAALIDQHWLGWLPLGAWALVLASVAIDALRTRELTLLNASGRQGAFAMLTALDAIARPAGAALLVLAAGASLEALLVGQAVGAGLVLAVFLWRTRRQGLFHSEGGRPAETDIKAFAHFSLPLAGIALVGWATGMADRYIVGGMLGLAAAGTYAAAYALGSRPLLLVGHITDSTLRQRLYGAHAAADPLALWQTVKLWLLANLGGGLLIALALTLAADLVVRLLLGAAFRAEAADLLPWIALGHIFYLGAQALERILYAVRRTRLVLVLQAITAIIGIAAAWMGAYWAGVLGVALAVPITFGAQLLMTFAATRMIIFSDQREA